jgi:ABC-type amino acid transport substrate-binding protein
VLPSMSRCVGRTFGPLIAALIALACTTPAAAEGRDLPEIREKGVIRIALYNDFPPYSARGKGIDYEIAEALAKRLQVRLDPLWFNADENVDDDLRNMVWKGHYLGIGPADAMIHAPIDPELVRRNPRVRTVAPYYRERLAIARDLKTLPKLEEMAGLTGVPVGAEDASLASIVLLSENGGSLRGNVHHFKTPTAAVEALKKGEVAAVMGQQGELQGLLKDYETIAIAPAPLMAGLGTRQWVLGVAVKKDHGALGDALEKAMSELAAEGELERIFARYGVDRTKP